MENIEHPVHPAAAYYEVFSAFVSNIRGGERHCAEHALCTGVSYSGRVSPASG